MGAKGGMWVEVLGVIGMGIMERWFCVCVCVEMRAVQTHRYIRNFEIMKLMSNLNACFVMI